MHHSPLVLLRLLLCPVAGAGKVLCAAAEEALVAVVAGPDHLLLLWGWRLLPLLLLWLLRWRLGLPKSTRTAATRLRRSDNPSPGLSLLLLWGSELGRSGLD